MFPENWHFRSCFVLKTTKTQLFVFITEILWQTFWRNNWQSIFDVVKILSLKIKNEFTKVMTPFRGCMTGMMHRNLICIPKPGNDIFVSFLSPALTTLRLWSKLVYNWHKSRDFLLCQLWSVNYYVNCMSKKMLIFSLLLLLSNLK